MASMLHFHSLTALFRLDLRSLRGPPIFKTYDAYARYTKIYGLQTQVLKALSGAIQMQCNMVCVLSHQVAECETQLISDVVERSVIT